MIRRAVLSCSILSGLMVSVAAAEVDVRPIPSSGVTVRVARCWRAIRPFDCWLTDLVTHAAATRDAWPVALRNLGTEPLKISDVDVVVTGERSDYGGFSSGIGVVVPPDGLLRPLDVTELQLVIQRSQLPRDTYRGTILVWFREAGARLEIPIVVSVRHGALWPMLALLAGILLGRTVKTPANREEFERAASTSSGALIRGVSYIAGVYPKAGEKGLRPFLFLGLLFALLVVGLDGVYLGNETFGSLSDYVTVFTWGFGADVVKVTLGDLPR